MSVMTLPEKSFRNILLTLNNIHDGPGGGRKGINPSALNSTFWAAEAYVEAVAEDIGTPAPTLRGDEPRKLIAEMVWDFYRLNRLAYSIRYKDEAHAVSQNELLTGPAEVLTGYELTKALKCIDYNAAEAQDDPHRADRLKEAQTILNHLLARFAFCLLKDQDEYQEAEWNGDVDRGARIHTVPAGGVEG